MCPILFEYGGITVTGYWLFVVLGLLAAYVFLTLSNAGLEGEKIPWYHRNNLFCLCMISIFFGGALLGFFVNLPELIGHWEYYSQSLQRIWDKAFSDRAFYGGAVLLALSVWWYVKHHRLNGETIARIFVPGVALFMVLSRIGCFMAGCCYGVAVPWGVVFPEGSLAPAGVPLFPSQLAEALGHLILFFVLLAIRNKLVSPYHLIWIYTGAYALLRFALEFFRGDGVRGIWGPFSTSQWISLALLPVVVIYLIKTRRNGKVKENEKRSMQ